MRLIPVIDLLQGAAVHAVRGERAAYSPLSCPLCPTGDPLRLAAAYVEGLAPDTLYVADLDAIGGHGDNGAMIAAIARLVAPATLWVDAGLGSPAALRRFRDEGVGRPVIGSESITGPAILGLPEAADALLSLDYRAEGDFVGPAALESGSELWPAEVIVMSLHRVGTGGGPDTRRLARCRERAPAKRYYAAGGVRDAGDLDRLAAAGAAGVLLASALHEGRLQPARPGAQATRPAPRRHGRS